MVTYTDPTAIAAYLGVTFSPEQATAAGLVAEAVTLQIDAYTGLTWQTTTPITGELDPVLPSRVEYPGVAGVVYLQHTPAVAVSAVSLRSVYPNYTPTTVLDAKQFELVDPANGVVTLAAVGWWYPMHAVVDYTYTAGVPADIQLAATMMAAAEMARQIAVQQASAVTEQHPEMAGLSSIAVGQNDIQLTRSATTGATGSGAAVGMQLAAPDSAARSILDSYKRIVIA